MIRLTEIITPFYLLLTIGFALMVLNSKERSLLRDPRLPGVIVRCVVYPAAIFSIFCGGFYGAGEALSSGQWWGFPTAAVAAIATISLVSWLAVIAVGNVRKILKNPPR